jgi:hypothetical protein
MSSSAATSSGLGQPARLVSSLSRWLWRHVVPGPIRRYFEVRFQSVTRSEGWGYLVWAIVGVAVAVPEIWAAASGSDFIWPTISGTIGHLEDEASIVALAPVAVLAGAALTLARVQVGSLFVQQDLQVLGRTPQGRLAKLGNLDIGPAAPVADAATDPAPTPQLIADPATGLRGRREWSVVRYLLVSVSIVVSASLAAAAAENKWLTGYVMYSLIAIFGFVLPNALAYSQRTRTDVPFTTLFATLRTLERRLHLTAIVIAAGLAILLIHLAVYPWPDLARDSASYAGLTPHKAEKKATEKLTEKYPDTNLEVSARSKEVVEGNNVWFVYFRGPHGYSNCVVRVTKDTHHVPPECQS